MVQLRRLHLRNLRSYESADLTFTPGTTLLVGDVGSGKTSVLYAIEMALFGFAEVDPTFLVRHQAPEAEVRLELSGDGHTYEFGRRFRRRTRRGREVFELESASYAEDGRRSSYSVTEIRERAIRLLGFPDNPNPRAHSDLWRWAVYVPQEKMREVLAQDPEERLETVRKALGLEQYRTAAENAQLLAVDLRRWAEGREASARGYDHYETDRTALAARLEDQRRAVAEWSQLQGREEATARTAEEEVARLEAERERLEQARTREAELAQALRSEEEAATRLEERAETRRRELRRISERLVEAPGRRSQHDALAAERARLVQELAGAEEERRTLAGSLEEAARLEGERSAAREARAHAESLVHEAQRERVESEAEVARLAADGPQREPPAPTKRSLPEIDAVLSEAQRRVDEAVAESAREAHVLEEVDELLSAGVCPRCHQPVDPVGFQGHRAELVHGAEKARGALASRREELLLLQDERRARERYERSLQRWQEVDRARAASRERLERGRAREVEAETRRARTSETEAALAATIARRAGPLEAARRRLEDLSALERRRRSCETQLEMLAAPVEEDRLAESTRRRLEEEALGDASERTAREGRRAALALERRDLQPRLAAREETLLSLRSARGRVDAARRAGADAAREVARAEAVASGLEGQIVEADRRLAERGRLLEESRARRALGQWLSDEFRTEVLQLERRLLARAQAEFERGFASYFATLVEDPGLTARCDPSFSPSVEIDGEWTPVEALSGGERTALALAFRLALGGVVRSAGRLALETLILDEPTDGFSPEQVSRMGELLGRLELPQVLLVSHESQLAGIADRVVRVEKQQGRSILRPPEGAEAPAGADLEAPPAGGAPGPKRRRVRTPKLEASAGPEGAREPREPTEAP